jgi:CRP-like cAMP-binding protein
MTPNSKTLLHRSIADLTDMSVSSSELLFEIATLRHYSKGENILKHGQICNQIVFVELGYLRTFFLKDGNEINTQFTFEGQFATNLKSLRSATSADTTIQAGEATTVYAFDKEKLLALYQVSPEIESFGRKLLEQLLITQEEHSSLFKLYSPAERYHHIETHQPAILQRISLSQLASYLGVARETLSRIRKNKM